MGFQLFAGAQHPGDNTFFEMAFSEVLLYNIPGGIPEPIRYHLADTPVPADREFMVVDRNVEQDPVGLTGVVHFQFAEQFPGAFHGVFTQAVFQVHADFP